MLGLSNSNNGNSSWKTYVGNFLAIWGGQLAYKLYDLLALNRFPTPYEIYSSGIGALVATLIIYGVNRGREK